MINEQEALKVFREMVENTRTIVDTYPAAFATKTYALRTRLDQISCYLQHEKLRLCYYKFRNLSLVLAWKWDYLLQEQVREYLKASLSEEDTELNATAMYCINGITRYVLGDSEGRAILDIERLKSDLEDEETFKAASEELESRILSELTAALSRVLDSFISSRREEISQLCNKLIQACNGGWDSVFDVIDDETLAADKVATLDMRR